jgi:hypothetical protein
MIEGRDLDWWGKVTHSKVSVTAMRMFYCMQFATHYWAPALGDIGIHFPIQTTVIKILMNTIGENL